MKEKFIFMKRGICKHNKLVILILLVTILPAFVSVMTTIKCLPVSNDNDWIGFWGAYFGGIITLIVFWGTLRNSSKEREKEEKERLFDLLISDTAYINELQNRISYDVNNNLIFELNKKVMEVKLRLEIAEERKLYSGAIKPIKCLDDMMEQIKKIQLLQIELFKDNASTNEEICKLKKELCAKGFVFEIKKFIQMNNN